MRVIKARCAQCGTMCPVYSDETPIEEIDGCVSWTVDPFASELHFDYTEMWLCGYCEHENALSV